MRLGRLEYSALLFIFRCAEGEWSSFGPDCATRRVIDRLEAKGFIETNSFLQFRVRNRELWIRELAK